MKQSGITLIALVVTIIVLLILAGVAISLTIGNNGIFTRAQVAVVKNENASVYEQLQFVVADYQMDEITTGSYTEILEKLKTDGYIDEENILNVETLMGRSMQTGKGSKDAGDVYVIEQREQTATAVTSDTSTDMDYYLIYYDDDNIDINLGLAFENGGLNWNKVFENAQKHPEQSKENSAIGIGPSGEPVNMDWWESIKSDTGYILIGSYGSGIHASYLGGFTENGEIIGEIPQYIKKAEDDKFYPVVSLQNTFAYLDELKIAPTIPSTVKSMHYTFYYCINLVEVKDIPNNVMEMDHTFYYCSKLKFAPELPSNIEVLDSTFEKTNVLVIIPQNVKKICGDWSANIIVVRNSTGKLDVSEANVNEASMIYKEDALNFYTFGNNYLKNYDETQLENIIITYIYIYMSPDNILDYWETSREEIMALAKEEDKTYIDMLKDIIIYDLPLEYGIGLEYGIYLINLDIPDSIKDLRIQIAQDAGKDSFEDLLSDKELTLEE